MGIFASRYIKFNNIDGNNAHKNDEFVNLFLSDKVVFSNAYLSINDEKLLPTPVIFFERKKILQGRMYTVYGMMKTNNIVHYLMIMEF